MTMEISCSRLSLRLRKPHNKLDGRRKTHALWLNDNRGCVGINNLYLSLFSLDIARFEQDRGLWAMALASLIFVSEERVSHVGCICTRTKFLFPLLH